MKVLLSTDQIGRIIGGVVGGIGVTVMIVTIIIIVRVSNRFMYKVRCTETADIIINASLSSFP